MGDGNANLINSQPTPLPVTAQENPHGGWKPVLVAAVPIAAVQVTAQENPHGGWKPTRFLIKPRRL